MAGNKSPRKKRRVDTAPGVTYAAQKFFYSSADSMALTMNLYLRLLNFKQGVATCGDRTSFMIRMYAGIKRLEDFESDGAEEILKEALDLLRASRVRDTEKKAKNPVRAMNAQEIDKICHGLNIVEQLFKESTLWEEAQAIKYGEDQLLIDAENWEYQLVLEE